MSLSRAAFGRNNIRKKQPRTNPNYVNIQIRTDDGSLRSTYIRLSDISKCQTLALSSSSSSSSHSSAEQDSILDCSQSYSNESNGYCPSDETISTDRTNDIEKRQPSNHQQSLSNSDEDHNHFAHTLTNRAALGMKQLITYTDGKVLTRERERLRDGRLNLTNHEQECSMNSCVLNLCLIAWAEHFKERKGYFCHHVEHAPHLPVIFENNFFFLSSSSSYGNECWDWKCDEFQRCNDLITEHADVLWWSVEFLVSVALDWTVLYVVWCINVRLGIFAFLCSDESIWRWT